MEFATNGKPISEIEDYCKTYPKTHTWRDLEIPEKDYETVKAMLYEMATMLEVEDDTIKIFRTLQRKYHHQIKPSHFTQVYLEECEMGRMKKNPTLENVLITRRCRGISGVTVVTIFLSPYPNGQQFSCKWNCHYCPNEPGQPRSYLFGEPGVLRANQNNFDCVKQMLSRIHSYKVNGHPTDKFEILILGGTIHSYPKAYLETFMRDMFYAANICGDQLPFREPLTLAEEKMFNTVSDHRIIGVTVETRPDCIQPQELVDFRRWGVTRVQIGVQHTDDAILRAVNRGCSHKHTLRAMKLLRDSCFKVDIHIMPNLPTATPEKDIEMMNVVLNELQPDQVKVYPCETTPFTKILEDYKQGIYVPYSESELERVIIYWKSHVHPWIRNNRIVRDIPDYYIVAGVPSSSERCKYQEKMKELGLACRCIRCREAGRHPTARIEDGKMWIRSYDAQGGIEYFISWESVDENVLFGFARLRLPPKDSKPVFYELMGTALVRELHVYGRTVPVGAEPTHGNVIQHNGIGRKLLEMAESIALLAGYKKIAVISGVGVRRYYEKCGYTFARDTKGEFMIKYLRSYTLYAVYICVAILVALCLLLYTFDLL